MSPRVNRKIQDLSSPYTSRSPLGKLSANVDSPARSRSAHKAQKPVSSTKPKAPGSVKSLTTRQLVNCLTRQLVVEHPHPQTFSHEDVLRQVAVRAVSGRWSWH